MPVAQPTYQELVDQIRELKAENEALRKRIAGLEAELRRLTGETDGTGGATAAREVPAFVRPARAKKRRRKRGRQPGHEGACRPVPDRIDRTEDVPAPDRCPRCDEALEPVDRIHEQVVEEIPPVEPQVVRYCFHGARCPRCRQVHFGYHPDVLPGSPLGMQVMLFVAFRQACMTRSERLGIVSCPPTMAWRTADAIRNDKCTSRLARDRSPTF